MKYHSYVRSPGNYEYFSSKNPLESPGISQSTKIVFKCHIALALSEIEIRVFFTGERKIKMDRMK